MSEAQPMPSVRRRPIPGMASQPITPPPAAPAQRNDDVEADAPALEDEASMTAQVTAVEEPVGRFFGDRPVRVALQPAVLRELFGSVGHAGSTVT